MITEIITRTASESDSAALRRIWQSAFIDGEDAIDAFYKSWQGHALTIVADCAGKPVSAGYLLPTGSLLGKPCAMIYAVATLPEYRGRGLASCVTRALITKAHETGYPSVIVCPAVDSLFDYYSSAADMRDGFYIREYGITSGELPHGEGFLTRLSAGGYMNLREEFLRDTVHVGQNQRVWEYQSVLCSMYGGGLFRITLPDALGCAVIERGGDDAIVIKELLIPRENEEAALSAIAASFDARIYMVRTPVTDADEGANVRRFGMLGQGHEMPIITSGAYFGMAFD